MRMRRSLAIVAVIAGVADGYPLVTQTRGGSRGGGSIGGAWMGRGGFSSHGSAGFRGGSEFRISSPLWIGPSVRSGRSAPVYASPLFELAGRSFCGSFGGFRQPVFGSRHFHHRAFLAAVIHQATTGITAIPPTTGSSTYSTPDYYSGYDYYGSSYSPPLRTLPRTT